MEEEVYRGGMLEGFIEVWLKIFGEAIDCSSKRGLTIDRSSKRGLAEISIVAPDQGLRSRFEIKV